MCIHIKPLVPPLYWFVNHALRVSNMRQSWATMRSSMRQNHWRLCILMFVAPWELRPWKAQTILLLPLIFFLKNMWLYMMKFKGEWLERFKKFKVFVNTQSEHKSKAFRWMSRGSSISKKKLMFFYKDYGIGNTPQDIGPAECHCHNDKVYAWSSKT